MHEHLELADSVFLISNSHTMLSCTVLCLVGDPLRRGHPELIK